MPADVPLDEPAASILAEIEDTIRCALSQAKEDAVVALAHRNHLRYLLAESEAREQEVAYELRTANWQGKRSQWESQRDALAALSVRTRDLRRGLAEANAAAESARESVNVAFAASLDSGPPRLERSAGWSTEQARQRIEEVWTRVWAEVIDRRPDPSGVNNPGLWDRARQRLEALAAADKQPPR
jgi:hypothetical protein